MANSATLSDVVPFQVGKLSGVLEYDIVIDTTDTELTVHTPLSGNRVFIVGFDFLEATSLNLTLMSGSSKSKTWELAANQGMDGEVKGGGSASYYFATKAGEALKIRSSVVIGASVGKNFVIKLVEGTQL